MIYIVVLDPIQPVIEWTKPPMLDYGFDVVHLEKSTGVV